jgi:hypothetical protein
MFLKTIQIIVFSCLIITGCKRKDKITAPVADKGAGYFSIIQFCKDQLEIHWGQPFTLEKIVVLNGKKDSSLVSSDMVDWGSVVNTFFRTDISDKKFLDQYSFSSFDDNASATRTYYYEAKNEDLFTRTLQIVADPFTNKIKSVYIETAKKGRFGEKTQKLFYIPVKVVQIQEFESAFVGPDRNLRIEYRFMN